MKIEELFPLRVEKMDIDTNSLALFPSVYVQFIKKYDIGNIKTKDAKIAIPNSNDFVYLSSFFDIEKVIKLT